MREGNIDAAVQDPAHRAQVCTLVDGQPTERIVDSVHGSWKSYYANISDVLNHGAELIVRPEQVYQAMRVYDAAMRSAQSAQVVALTEGRIP